MKLYIIRHGDPNYEKDCLTPLGKRQAEALARRFAVNPLDRIYASPLGRAQETARPTCEVLKKEMTILDWTSEALAYDQLGIRRDGRSRWRFAQQETNYKNNNSIRLYDDWTQAHEDFAGDSVKEGIARIADASDAFLKELGYEREGCVYRILNPSQEAVGVFCHQGFGLTWLAHLMQIPPHIVWATFDLSHSSVTLFEFKNYDNGLTTPKCLQLSDLSHIFADGLPMTYNNKLRI
ncbi:MAG: histidine phosphatase family protein [Eubacteriales bacterium]|nr:histidine phosphatase family protein [Eubacteriales bacterium]